MTISKIDIKLKASVYLTKYTLVSGTCSELSDIVRPAARGSKGRNNGLLVTG